MGQYTHYNLELNAKEALNLIRLLNILEAREPSAFSPTLETILDKLITITHLDHLDDNEEPPAFVCPICGGRGKDSVPI